MLTVFENELFVLHYENDPADDTDPDPDPAPGPKGASGKEVKWTPEQQAAIDAIVAKRTEKARKTARENFQKYEEMAEKARLTEDQRVEYEAEAERLRRQTLTAEEITKREAKKAKDAYESRVTNAEKAAQTWEQRFKALKVNNEIQTSAAEHGVLPTSIPFVAAFLGNNIKLEPVKSDTGEIIDFTTIVNFTDPQGADGKPVEVQLPVSDTLKRMKELPDLFGNFFQAPSSGGTGTNGGRPNPAGGKQGYRPGMSQEEYMRLRKENPAALGLV